MNEVFKFNIQRVKEVALHNIVQVPIILIMIWALYFFDKKLLAESLFIGYLIITIPFIYLMANYYHFSKRTYKYLSGKNIILEKHGNFTLFEMTKIVKVDKVESLDAGRLYLSWLTKNIFYYRFEYDEGIQFFIPCFMLSKSQEELISIDFKDLLEIKTSWFPII